MLEQIRSQSSGGALAFAGRWSRVRFSPLGLLLDCLLAWQERARQRYQLQQMDNSALRDIGLTRADVQAECTKPFWRV